MTVTEAVPQDDVRQLQRLVDAVTRLRSQVAQRIVGQEDVVDGILTAVLAGGHALLIGVPGLAKTLMVQTVAEALDLTFIRVHFTPDLMWSDITVTEIIEEHLSVAEWDALGQSGQDGRGKRELLLILGLMLEDATDDERAKFLGALPIHARAVWRRYGAYAYRRYVRRVRGAAAPAC